MQGTKLPQARGQERNGLKNKIHYHCLGMTRLMSLRAMDAEMLIPEEARQRYIERRKKDIESLRSALSLRAF